MSQNTAKLAVEGDIALCRAGHLGLIKKVADRGGRVMYLGVHIEKDRKGQPWQSVDPQVIGNIRGIASWEW